MDTQQAGGGELEALRHRILRQASPDWCGLCPTGQNGWRPTYFHRRLSLVPHQWGFCSFWRSLVRQLACISPTILV